jgi:magnesium-transporting ATPase (P-type)
VCSPFSPTIHHTPCSLQIISKCAAAGWRSLGVAIAKPGFYDTAISCNDDLDLQYELVGYIAIYDKPREDSAVVIAQVSRLLIDCRSY